MNIQNLRKLNFLAGQRNKMKDIVFILNAINGQEGSDLSVPLEALAFVDRVEAAKGLLSLLIPALAEVEAEIESLGVSLEAPPNE
jgi:hypothetical protein